MRDANPLASTEAAGPTDMVESSIQRATRRLAPGVVHELSTPIQYVSDNLQFLASFLEELQRTPDRGAHNAMIRDACDAVRESLEGVSEVRGMIDSFRWFAMAAPARAQGDLNVAVEHTVRLARHEWKYGASLDMDLASDIPPIDCAADELKALLIVALLRVADRIGAGESRASGQVPVRVATRRTAAGAEVRFCAPSGTLAGIDERWHPGMSSALATSSPRLETDVAADTFVLEVRTMSRN